jgi:hypothetical protein
MLRVIRSFVLEGKCRYTTHGSCHVITAVIDPLALKNGNISGNAERKRIEY